MTLSLKGGNYGKHELNRTISILIESQIVSTSSCFSSRFSAYTFPSHVRSLFILFLQFALTVRVNSEYRQYSCINNREVVNIVEYLNQGFATMCFGLAHDSLVPIFRHSHFSLTGSCRISFKISKHFAAGPVQFGIEVVYFS